MSVHLSSSPALLPILGQDDAARAGVWFGERTTEAAFGSRSEPRHIASGSPSGPRRCLPTTPAEMDGPGLGRRRRRLRHGRRLRRSSGVRDGDPGPRAGGGRVPRGDPQPARLAECRALAAVRPAAAVLRHQRREHGQHDQPLHGQQEGPQRRRLQPRRPDRPAARPRHACPTASGPARPSRACRSSPAASRPRSAGWPITTTGATPSSGRSCSTAKADLVVFGMGEQPIVEIARRLAAGRDGQATCATCAASPTPWAPARRRRPTRSSLPIVRGGEDRQAEVRPGDQDHPPGDQPAQRQDAGPVPRPPGRRLQPARRCRSARRTWTGSTACPTPARPHPMYKGERDPGVRGGQGLGDDHARLLRRLHVLLDHGPPGADHPVAVAGVDPGRAPPDGPGPEVLGRRLRHRRADGQHVPDALHAARGRGEVQAALVRASRRSASCWAPTTARSSS